MKLVRTCGTLSAVADRALPPLTDELVRATIEHTRR
jgi:hypothetical protein